VLDDLVEQREQQRFANGVVRELAVHSALHQPKATHAAELVGDGGVAQPEQVGEIAHTQCLLTEGAENADPCGMCEHMEQLRDVLGDFLREESGTRALDPVIVGDEHPAGARLGRFGIESGLITIEHLCNRSRVAPVRQGTGSSGGPMRWQSTLEIPGMDCPTEERLIRMALDSVDAVDLLRFDLVARQLVVVHSGPADPILDALRPLGMGARLAESLQTTEADAPDVEPDDPATERRVLWQVLGINATMFVVELGFGLHAESTGLVADSLDMLADALVYGVSLFAVGRTTSEQRRAARFAGWLQLVLALGALGEVVRRALAGSEPAEGYMIGVAAIALAANLACLALLSRHRRGGLHLRASWIFSTNDALANLGVIFAGVGVAVTGSALPDLVVGALVGVVVLSGAVRILRLRA